MKKIIHIDMDCFYAAVEVRDNPALKGLPVAVGGPDDRRGVICSANYEARRFGVRSAQATSKSVRLCPDLRLIFPSMAKYSAESKKIQAVFRRYTDLIEPLSLDEAYLDVTASDLYQGSATLIAREIRRQIFNETGLTASAGIAPNKFLAKVASDWKKPNGQFTVSPAMVDEFVRKLPVEKIWGVGKVTAKKLQLLGHATCGDLQRVPLSEMRDRFGAYGFTLYDLCRGVDHRQIITDHEPKSLSAEQTFTEDAVTIDDCLDKMPAVYERFLRRCRNSLPGDNILRGRSNNYFVKIKFSDFTSTTTEGPFEGVSLENFQKLLIKGHERKSLPVRLIGLGVRFKAPARNFARAGFEENGQLSLFP